MKRHLLKVIVAGAGIILAGSAGVRADVLYSNYGNGLPYIFSFPNNQQIGEQIWLGTGATPEYLTNFSFEYYSPDPSWSGTVTADVKFYQNDGTPPFNGYATPGTLFYDSGAIPFPNPLDFTGGTTNGMIAIFGLSDLQSPPGGYVLDPNMPLPSTFTFTITFSGLTGTESVALPYFNPPTVGANAGDYWFDASGTWQLLTNPVTVGFGADFNGSPQPTPEPSVICLSALGGAALMAMIRRRQRRG